jgi:hypothetical protein
MARVRSTVARTRVRSTARSRDGAFAVEGESCDNTGSTERIESAGASDVGSQSHAGGDSDEGSHTHSYYFGPSTVAISCVQKMIDCGYFTEGSSRVPGEETVPRPDSDEAIMFEDYFTAGLTTPPQPVLSNILLKFQVQLHQLTPNAIGQLSKYIWVVVSFSGVPTVDDFAKRYGLHYQPKKMSVDRVEVLA